MTPSQHRIHTQRCRSLLMFLIDKCLVYQRCRSLSCACIVFLVFHMCRFHSCFNSSILVSPVVVVPHKMVLFYVAHCPMAGSSCKNQTAQICADKDYETVNTALVNHLSTSTYHPMTWADADKVADAHAETCITDQDWPSDDEQVKEVPASDDDSQSLGVSYGPIARRGSPPASHKIRPTSPIRSLLPTKRPRLIDEKLDSMRRAEMALRHAATIARNAAAAFESEADTMRNIRRGEM
jgi:hypothetical protein